MSPRMVNTVILLVSLAVFAALLTPLLLTLLEN